MTILELDLQLKRSSTMSVPQRPQAIGPLKQIHMICSECGATTRVPRGILEPPSPLNTVCTYCRHRACQRCDFRIQTWVVMTCCGSDHPTKVPQVDRGAVWATIWRRCRHRACAYCDFDDMYDPTFDNQRLNFSGTVNPLHLSLPRR